MSHCCILCNTSQCKFLGTLPHGVTSDSRLWPYSGQLLVCEHCGHIQKNLNEKWLKDVASIYASYRVHAIEGVQDHMLFDRDGVSQSKSAQILQRLRKEVELPTTGHVLDVGCGIGSFLRQFHTIMPTWALHGLEVAVHFRERVLAIPGVEAFYTDIADIKKCFDLIVLNDVLEHVPQPVELLTNLKKLLKPGGKLFIRCPNFAINPFDLCIVDHCSHYTQALLRPLLQKMGFTVRFIFTDWLEKEHVLIACLQGQDCHESCDAVSELPLHQEQVYRAAVQWLNDNSYLLAAKTKIGLGIYGTSVAATWAAGFCNEKLLFFVDDDEQRQGKTHLGREIIPMCQAPADIPVFLAFPPAQAASLVQKVTRRYPLHKFLLNLEYTNGK